MKKAMLLMLLWILPAVAMAADPGFYLYGAFGQTNVDINKSDIDNSIRAVTGIMPVSTLDTTDTGFKFQAGYQINPNIAIEGGWVDLGKATYRAALGGGVTATADTKANGFSIAALGIVPINDQFSAFGKIGTINAKVDETATVSGPLGSASANVTSTSWSPIYGAGVMFKMSPTVSVRAEYEIYSNLGDSATTGTADVKMLSIGAMFRF